MKPTREQVLQWAREAGIGWLERAEGVSEFLEHFSTLAYEAGRKDENEECATMCEVKFDFCGDELIVAEAIRTRRKQ